MAVKQVAVTFEMSDTTIYNWLKQERIARGEAEGATTSQQLELPRPNDGSDNSRRAGDH